MTDIDENLVIDTLLLAKQKYIGQSVSLDALCRKFNIDISNRTIHGALKDAKLLSLVYLELIGGKQTRLNFLNNNETFKDDNNGIFDLINFYNNKPIIPPKRVNINIDDYKLHIESIKQIPKSIWETLKS